MESPGFDGPMLSPREKLLAENAAKAEATSVEVDRLWDEYKQGQDPRIQWKVAELAQKKETQDVAFGLANKAREAIKKGKDEPMAKAA